VIGQPQYDFTVKTQGFPEGKDLTRAEWNAQSHRPVIVDCWIKGVTSPEDQLNAHRWAAGVLARITMLVNRTLMQAAEVKYQSHACHDQELECGAAAQVGVLLPQQSIEDGVPPLVLFWVPKSHLKEWVARIENLVYAVLLADAQPPKAPAAPQAQEPSHPQPALFETPAPVIEETTR